MSPSKFRKKPVVIEAWQLTNDNHYDVMNWINAGIWEHRAPGQEMRYAIGYGDHLVIPTLEGDHKAEDGDYVIQGIAHEFYPCKPDIFAATYEPVE